MYKLLTKVFAVSLVVVLLAVVLVMWLKALRVDVLLGFGSVPISGTALILVVLKCDVVMLSLAALVQVL